MPDKRAIQPEDLFNLRFLNAGKLSPDASQVVYTVSQINAEKDKEYSTIFLLNLGIRIDETTDKRQSPKTVTLDGRPDGKSIAFVSDRDGKQQLYLLPVDGGEARQLTEAKRGIGGGFAWSLDGSKIAFSAVPAVEPIDLGKEPYRVDRMVYRFDAIGYLDQTVQDIIVLDPRSGETRQLSNDRTNNVNLRWSPDGSEILYDATMRADAALAMIPDLMTVDLDGNRKPILQGWASIEGANFTPDGKQIVFIGRPADGKPIGTKSDLYLLDIATGDTENRTTGWQIGIGGHLSLDMPVEGMSEWNTAITDVGQTAISTVQEGGTVHIYRIALSGAESYQSIVEGRVRCVSAGSAGGSTALCEHGAQRAARSAPGQHDR